MYDKTKLRKLESWVKKKSLEEKSGHDYEHAKRVTNLALVLAKKYKNIDYEVLISSCLVHDIHEKKEIPKILKELKFDREKTEKIKEIIVQFRHIGKKPKEGFKKSIEAEIFMDADNLEALGGIGITRAIFFGRSKNFPVFKSKEDSLNDSIYGTIKELTNWYKFMFTKKAKRIGKKRTKIMKLFLGNIEKEFG